MSQIPITQKIGSIVPTAVPKSPVQATEVGKTSFDNVLSGIINDVNGLQGEAGALRERLLIKTFGFPKFTNFFCYYFPSFIILLVFYKINKKEGF